jgi:hypothetical protein
MHADCYFATGSSHSVCQDYALARDSYVIVSDGCSSSPHTDFGSRFLAHSLDQVFQLLRPGDHKIAVDRAATMAITHARSLGLPPECIDATLLYARVAEDFVYFGLCGDGAIAVRHKDGTIDLITAAYESGAPYYPSYEMDQNRKEQYIAEFGLKRTEVVTKFKADGELRYTAPITDTESFVWPVDNVELILVMSDGIHSFLKTVVDGGTKTQQKVLIQDVVKPLMAFKLMKGKFVERRAKRFLKECQKNNIQHYDDVSVAGIAL